MTNHATIQLALDAFRRGDFATTERHCRSVLRLQPDDAEAQHLLGLVAQNSGHTDAALALLLGAVRSDPRQAGYRTNLALVYERRGELEAAIAANRDALRIDAGHFPAHHNLANVLRLQGEFDAALPHYRAALESRPADVATLANLAGALRGLGRLDEAADQLREALRVAPERAELHSNLGNLLLDQGDAASAAECYRRSIELEPHRAEWHCNLATACLRSGASEQAEAGARRALAEESGERTALGILGVSLARQHKVEELARLLDYDRFLHSYAVSCPAEFSNIDAFNDALRQHVLSHPTLEFEPFSKSTTGGYQSRNLLVGDPGPVACLAAEIRANVQRYLDAVRADSQHPFPVHALGQWRLNIWVTVLDAQGHQKPHIHPAGWLSGVYYVDVPGDANADDHAGWIEFGRAPAEYGDTTHPSITLRRPRNGLMFLFPSYFYHRTLPFAGDRQRISIAFDVLPEEDYTLHDESLGRDVMGIVAAARAHLRRGEFIPVERHCRQALKIDSRNADAWHVYGVLADRMGNLSLAAKRLEIASSLAPDNPRILHDLGGTLQRMNRQEQALMAYRGSLALSGPDADTLIAMATVSTDLGDFETARDLYRQALAARPQSGRAHYGLALIRTFAPGDAQIAAMETTLKDNALADADRSALHFALGRACEDCGDYGPAFRHFDAGNRIKRASVKFDLDAEVANTRRIIGAFPASIFEKFTGCGDPSRIPVLVVGMPRSGTTLVEQIVASHPQVFGAGEINELWRTISMLSSYLPAGRQLPEAVSLVQRSGWRDVGARYVAALRQMAPDALRVTDKLPFNYTLLGLVRLMLPNAFIINCVRDPLDTCVSCYTTSFAGDRGFTSDLHELGVTYRTYETLMDHWRRVLPGGIVDVRYEDLTADVESGARRIIDALALPWAEECLSFHRLQRPVATASYAQVRRPAYRTSVGRAQRYSEWLGPLRAALETPIEVGAPDT